MTLASSPSSGSLGHMMRSESSGSLSVGTASLSRSPSKRKRLQSAYLDEKRGTWRCRNCGWTYPIPTPDHHVRREHKKHCEGALKVQNWLGAVRFRPEEGTETLHDDAKHTPASAEHSTTKDVKDEGAEKVPDGAEKGSDGHGVKDQIMTHGSDGIGGLNVGDPVESGLKTTGAPDASLVEAKAASEAPQNLKVEKRELDVEKVSEAESKPRVDDDLGAMRSSQEGEESDTKPSRGARKDSTDHIDPSGVKSSEFVAASEDSEGSGLQSVDNVNKLEEEKQAGSGSLDGKGTDTKEWPPLFSQEDVDKPKSGEHAVSAVEETEEGGSSLADGGIAFKEGPEIEEDVGKKDPSLAADDEELTGKAEVVEEVQTSEPSRAAADDDDTLNNKAQVVEEGEQSTPADDNVLESKIEKGGERIEHSLMDADIGAVSKKAEGEGTKDLLKDTEPGAVARDGTDDEPSSVARDGTDDEPSSIARDGTDDKTEEEHQSLPAVAGGTLGEASQKITPPEQADFFGLFGVARGDDSGKLETKSIDAAHRGSPEQADLLGLYSVEGDDAGKLETKSIDAAHPELADLLGLYSVEGGDPGKQETKSIDAALLEPKDVVAVGQTSSGTVIFSSAERNWEDWQHVVSGEDILPKDGIPPSSEEAGDAELPFSGDQQAHHGQSHDGKTLEVEPEGPVQGRWDVVDKVDSAEGGNEDRVLSATLTSQQDTDETSSTVLVRLTAAEANWDDWDDVIKSGSLLIQEIKPLSSKKGENAGSSSGDHQISHGVVVVPEGSGSAQKKIDAILEPEGAVEGKTEHDTETGSPSLTLHIPEGVDAAGFLASKALSADNDLSTGKEANLVPASDPAVPEDSKTNSSKPTNLKQSSDENVPHSTSLTSQPETGQTSRPLTHLSSAERNWEDWEDVVRESGGESRQKKMDPGLEPALGERETGPDTDVKESDSPLGGEWVELGSSQEANDLRIAKDPGEEGEGPTYEMQRECKKLESPVSSLDRKEEGIKTVDIAEDTPQHELGQEGIANLSQAGLDDLTSSEYKLLDDDGGSPSLKRRTGRTGRIIPPSFEGTEREMPTTLRSQQGVSRTRSVKSDYSAGPLSSRDIKVSLTSIPALSQSKVESEDSIESRPPVVSTRIPAGYLISRQDGSNGLQEREKASKAYHDHQHCHHHGHEEHSSTALASKYDVVSLLRKQSKYDLKCPICGSLITQKIVLRKKKRRFVRESEIKPAGDDDDRDSPRSDTSSEMEDEKWNEGVGACLSYFFKG